MSNSRKDSRRIRTASGHFRDPQRRWWEGDSWARSRSSPNSARIMTWNNTVPSASERRSRVSSQPAAGCLACRSVRHTTLYAAIPSFYGRD